MYMSLTASVTEHMRTNEQEAFNRQGLGNCDNTVLSGCVFCFAASISCCIESECYSEFQ